MTRSYIDLKLRTGDTITLPEENFQHLVRVLRHNTGDEITLFNNRGGEFLCRFGSIGKREAQIDILSHDEREAESPLQTHLGLVMSKGDRMDYAIQKATELGVNHITPLTSERCEVRLKELDRIEKKTDHWQKVAISACEQCGRNRLPVVSAPLALDAWLESLGAERKFVLHHRSTASLALMTQQSAPASIALLIGPEGGLSSNEIDRALQKGFEALTLGPRVLRTETAPLVVLSALNSIWGDFR